MESDQEFYARRSAEEDRAAAAATHPEAALRHRMLADRYAALAQGMPAPPDRE